MPFIFNTATLEVIEPTYFEMSFVDESVQAVYNSMSIPGEIDQVTFMGFKSPQSTVNAIFSGEDVVRKIEKLKSFISFSQKQKGTNGVLSTLFKATQICNLKMLDVPVKTILITQVTTRYNLEFINERKMQRAIAAINYIELKNERKWWETLQGFSGAINISSLPPDIEKIKTEYVTSQKKVIDLTKQVADLKAAAVKPKIN